MAGLRRTPRGTTPAPAARTRPAPVPPPPHPSGARPPQIPRELVPRHVAVVMDGNGRWANARGLPRTAGHTAGEASLLDVVAGAIEIGVQHVSAYAFSTENWSRSPEEVRFLMGFNRDVLRRRRDLMDSWGVRVRWAGRRPRLWRSVIAELETAEEQTRDNTVCTLTMCVNYGGRAEVADAARAIAEEVAAGRLRPDRVDEKLFARYLDEPDLPDVDLFVRSSGEQRTSNFLIWQAAYAELVFLDEPWPDVDRRHLWRAVETYARRDRRYGGAVDAVADEQAGPATIDPATTDPATTGHATTGHATTGHATTGRATTDPATTDPATTDPDGDGTSGPDEGLPARPTIAR